MCCAIWYHLYNLRNVKNTHAGVLLLVNLQKSNTPPWMFFTFFKLCKGYQIIKRISHLDGNITMINCNSVENITVI